MYVKEVESRLPFSNFEVIEACSFLISSILFKIRKVSEEWSGKDLTTAVGSASGADVSLEVEFSLQEKKETIAARQSNIFIEVLFLVYAYGFNHDTTNNLFRAARIIRKVIRPAIGLAFTFVDLNLRIQTPIFN